MRNRLLILALLVGGLTTGRVPAQSVYRAELPEKMSDHADYRRLEAEKAVLWAAVRDELQRADSENVRFYLELALRESGAGDEQSLRRMLDRLEARRSLAALDLDALLALAARLGEVNAGLARLRELYRYAGPAMTNYLPDTTRRDLREEFAFYDLRPGSRIAELGAGDGAFAAAIAATVPGATLYINEVDSHLLGQIAYQLQYHPVFRRTRALAIRGTATATGLEKQELDAVIIRNAVHHFEHLEEMLYAIRQSMADGARLLLRERFREDCREDCCPLLISRQALYHRLEKAGFHLVDRREINAPDGPWSLLRWEWRSP